MVHLLTLTKWTVWCTLQTLHGTELFTLLKFSKLIIVGLIAGASALWKWITGKKKDSGNDSTPQIGSEDPLA